MKKCEDTKSVWAAVCGLDVAAGVPGRRGGLWMRMVAAGLARTFRCETCLAGEKDGPVCCPEEKSRVTHRKRESENTVDPRRSGEQGRRLFRGQGHAGCAGWDLVTGMQCRGRAGGEGRGGEEVAQ